MNPEETAEKSRLNLDVLRPYLATRRGWFALAALSIIVGVGLELWIPQILAEFIDEAFGDVPLSQLIRLAAIYIGAGIGAQLMSIASRYVGTAIGWSIANDLRIDATRHVASLDLDYHTHTSAGALIERVDGDIDAVAKMFSHFAVQVISGILLLGGIFVLTFRENILAGWTVVIFSAFVVLAMYLLRGFAVAATKAERGTSAELYGFIEERLAAIEDIRANGAGDHVMGTFQTVMRRYYTRSVSAWIKRSVIWTTSIGMFSLGTLLALAVGAYLVFQGQITYGVAFLIIQYMSKLEGPIEEITDQMQEVQKAAAGLGRLRELFGRQPTVSRVGTSALSTDPLEVEFDSVTFAYDSEPVLDDVSFRIAPGTHIGLLGRTGSGKSTITKLIARFYDASSGTVLLDGQPISDVEESSLRARVAMITQDVQLFEGSVRDNVAMFVRDRDDNLIDNALNEIGLGQWLASLPDGINTHLDTAGKGLSSGEAQLVALARAYLLDPGLVILDEPSSRVDPATEIVLSAALDRLIEGRTAIIIAHRLATVAHVDEIMVLEHGRVVEHGARRELAANPDSLFAHLLETAKDGLIRDEVPL